MGSEQPLSTIDVRDVLYKRVDDISLYLDIIQPARRPEQPMPVVVYIHGGGWLSGQRTEHANAFLAAAGFFTVSIDYRFSSQAIFPAQLEDVHDAILWLREHASEYHIDANRIGVWGHSAGGHLASLLGTSASMQVPGEPYAGVQAVVALSGPVDLLQMGGWHDAPDSPEARLLGGPVQQRVKLARQANPISYINAELPPFLLIHGTADTTVPASQSELLFHALQDIQADATFMPLLDEDHMFSVYGKKSWDHIYQSVQAFFQRSLCHPS